MRDGFLVGCHHAMKEEDVDYVCACIRAFVIHHEVAVVSRIHPVDRSEYVILGATGFLG